MSISKVQSSKFKVQSSRGFTLVELLIVIFITALIAAVGGDVLVSTLRSSNKTNIINEINQNANFVLTTIESVVRNAKSAQVTGTTTLRIVDQYNQIVYFCLGSLNVVDKSGVTKTVGIVARNGVGCAGPFAQKDSLTNTSPETGVDVILSGAGSSQFSISNSNPPMVTVNLSLRQGPSVPGRLDYQSTSTFTKSMEVRKY